MSLPTGTRVPLSPSQRSIWFFTRLYPDSAEYNASIRYEFAAAPGRECLTSSVRALMERHDALRIRVLEVDGVPVQEACEELEPPIAWHDLSHLPDAEARRRARVLLDEAAALPLRTDKAPLFRVTVAALPSGGALVAFGYHHLIIDYLSVIQLNAELSALLAGRPLPADAMGYLDYLATRAQEVSPARERRELGYWKNKLGGELAVLDLPADRPRPARASRRGGLVSFTVPPELTARLLAYAKREGALPFAVLLAGYKALIARLTSRSDLIVGAPLAGRDTPEAERVVGCFIKPVALRTDLSGPIAFHDLVHRVQVTLLEALDNQNVPYERVVAGLGIPRLPGVNPVFQTIFGYQSGEPIQMDNVEVDLLKLGSDSARADLTVSVTLTGNVMDGVMEYACDLFDEARIERYAGMYVHLLARAMDAPGRLISELELGPAGPAGYAAGAPAAAVAHYAGPPAVTRTAEIVPPDSATERRLIAIFRQVLDVAEVSVTDGFFQLGGHSMLAFKVIDACGKEFGFRPSVSDFFAASSSVRELADLINAALDEQAPFGEV